MQRAIQHLRDGRDSVKLKILVNILNLTADRRRERRFWPRRTRHQYVSTLAWEIDQRLCLVTQIAIDGIFDHADNLALQRLVPSKAFPHRVRCTEVLPRHGFADNGDIRTLAADIPWGEVTA